MRRAALLLFLCLLALNNAYGSGEQTLIDGSGLAYKFEVDGHEVSSSCFWTGTSTWVTTGTTCFPTSFGSSSCTTTGYWTSSSWTTCSTTSTWNDLGVVNEASYVDPVSASTASGGMIMAHLGDAFDDYGKLSLSTDVTIDYRSTGSGVIEDNGRQIVFPTQTEGNLQITRKMFVPDDDAFCRWLNIVTNTGTEPEQVVLRISGDLGSDSSTVVMDSSSGDTLADTSDIWLVSMEDFQYSQYSSDPRLAHVLQGQGAPVSATEVHLQNGDDGTLWAYTFTLQPGQTGIIMTFVSGQPTIAAARAKAIELSDPSGTALSYMTPEEKAAILNFTLTPYRSLTVNSLEDNETSGDGLVTLREAIIAANNGGLTDLGQQGGPFCLLDMSELSGTINLGSTLPAITGSMIMDGPVRIAGDTTFRLMTVRDGNLTLKNLTLSGGLAKGGDGASTQTGGGGGGAMGAGGALFLFGGSFKAVNVTFTDNGAIGGNGGDSGSLTETHLQGGGGGGLGGDGVAFAGGDGGPLLGNGGNTGIQAGTGGGGYGGDIAINGGAGGYGGGGGGGGTLGESLPAGAGGAGGFGGGGGGAGLAAEGLNAAGGVGGTYAGAGGSSAGAAGGGGGGGGGGLGGAIYSLNCRVVLKDCLFSGNYAQAGIGGNAVTPGTDGEGHGGGVFADMGTRMWSNGVQYMENSATTDSPDFNEFTLDMAPAVMAVELLSPLPITGNTMRFMVTFTSDVTGVDSSDFEVVGVGSIDASVISVEGEGDTYVVTIEIGPCEGQIGLRVLDDDSIADSDLATPLGDYGVENGQYFNDFYGIDNIAPGAPTVLCPEVLTAPLNWSWAPGGGGNGTFRWRLNGEPWTETQQRSYLLESADYGDYLFEVQETDDNGNWSESGICQFSIRQRMYVDSNEGSDENDGLSWETAKETIDGALYSLETSYADIWVKSGIYFGPIQIESHTRLFGGFDGTEDDPEDRDLSTAPSVIYSPGDYGLAKMRAGGAISVFGGDTVIDGFNITGNFNVGQDEPNKMESLPGGGILYFGFPDKSVDYILEPNYLRNCRIFGNVSQFGGGLSAIYTNLYIENCTFSGNFSMQGAGIFADEAFITATNCTFARQVDGAYLGEDVVADFVNCIFADLQYGVYTDGYAEASFTNCLFNGNVEADLISGSGLPRKGGMMSIVGAEQINAIDGNSGNIDGDPSFMMDGPQGVGGDIEDVDFGEFLFPILEILDEDANYAEDELAGKAIEITMLPPEGEQGEEFIFACQIFANDSSTIWCAAPIFLMMFPFDADFASYRVVDFDLMMQSAAVDTGTPQGAPDSDIEGTPRPVDIPGYGADNTAEEWDIGAYENNSLHVLAVTRADANPTNADEVAFNVVFSRPVTGVDDTDFALVETGTLSGYAVQSVSALDSMLFLVTVATGAGDGTLRLDVIDDDTIVDADGNMLGDAGAGNGDYALGQSYDIDKTAPVISSLRATPDLAKLGTSVNITFESSEPGEASVTVNEHAASYVSSDSQDFMFSYVIGDADPDGCAALNVQVQDAAGNVGSVEVCDAEVLEVDKTPPALSNLAANPTLARGGVEVTMTFTVSETLAAAPTVTVAGAAAVFAAVDGLNYTYAYTVSAADADGTPLVQIALADPAGNTHVATAVPFAVDNTPPAFADIVSLPATMEQGGPVTITFSASEPLQANPVVTVNGHPAAFASQGDMWYTYTYNVQISDAPGAATLAIAGVDLAGNEGGATNSSALTVTAAEGPSVSVGAPSLAATGVGPVTFAVTYGSDAMQITLDAADITLVGSGASGAVDVAQAGPFDFTVTVSSITGDGTLGIEIAAGTAADAYGNLAAAAGPSALVDIDNTAPVITITGDNPMTVELNGTYTEEGATALDARDGDLTEAITTTGDVDSSFAGEYTITYSVADAVGNSATAERTVYVGSGTACGTFKFPLNGSTITASESPEFTLVPVLEVNQEGVARVEFFLDDVSIGESTLSPYKVSHVLTATEEPVDYVLTVQAYDAEGNIICATSTAFDVVLALTDDDVDGNGLPDNPFTVLPETGNTWFSKLTTDTGGTLQSSAATLHNCEENPAPVVITLVDTEQRVTVSAPDALFDQCEMAVVVFQMATDLDTLLGAEPASALRPEPDAVFLAGGMYYLCTILVSADGGQTFEEIDPARLAANPISLVIEGALVPDNAVFYTHGIFTDSDPNSGVIVTGAPGEWGTGGVTNIELFGAAVMLDVVEPTVFAPYTLKAEKPVWPWLAALALGLGVALGGGDDGSSGPCFIATAAYGTPMAADINVLRSFRDRYMLTTAVGSAAVDAYYRVSPAIADVIASHPTLAAATRLVLVPVILLAKALLAAPVLVAVAALLLAAAALRLKARRAA